MPAVQPARVMKWRVQENKGVAPGINATLTEGNDCLTEFCLLRRSFGCFAISRFIGCDFEQHRYL